MDLLVATIRLQGRLKIYGVVDRQAAPKPIAQSLGLRPAFEGAGQTGALVLGR